MELWRTGLSVAAGGALGAVARFLLTLAIERIWGHPFPLATLCVNVMGCAILGALGTYFALHLGVSPAVQVFFTTGFLGAFTTFSTFAVDTLRLSAGAGIAWATLNVALQLVLGLSAARLGASIVQNWHLP